LITQRVSSGTEQHLLDRVAERALPHLLSLLGDELIGALHNTPIGFRPTSRKSSSAHDDFYFDIQVVNWKYVDPCTDMNIEFQEA